MDAVGDAMPITNGKVMMFAGLKGSLSHPISPTSQSVPMPTGSSANITEPIPRKWKKTRSAMAAREYHAA